MAGVCYNVRVGSPVFEWAADHLEAAASRPAAPARRPMPPSSSWPASGTRCACSPARRRAATGTVVGKHAFVLIDFPQQTLDLLGPGDRLLVRAPRAGARACSTSPTWRSAAAARSCSTRCPVRVRDGALEIAVAAEIPAFLMGAGIGMSSEWANCDVMLTRADSVADLGYEHLRIGDVVAMTDQDHRYGRGSPLRVVRDRHRRSRDRRHPRPRHGRHHDHVRPARAVRARGSIAAPTSAPAWGCRHERRSRQPRRAGRDRGRRRGDDAR